MISGKKILVGITGGIAAYKTVLLVRELKKEGAEVKVILTPSARDFVSSVTLSTLSENPVFSEFVKNEQGEWVNHVDLGSWADVFIIAPCTANTLSKIVSGSSDNLLIATYLSSRCPVLLAPAMDLDMFSHPTTQKNLAEARSMGVQIVDAEYGELASGLVGKGRMAEPVTLLEHIKGVLNTGKPGGGKKVLVTAGPTQEPLDPVRFISNHSSGKMGYLIAEKLTQAGFEVTLVSGPTQIEKPPVSHFVPVTTAREMYDACMKSFDEMDIVVLSAAVADYAPQNYEKSKIKKTEDNPQLPLIKNPDIARTLGDKKDRQFIVGFALETDNEEENARNKLKSKNMDLIVLNSLADDGAGFGHDTNRITIFDKDNNKLEFELKSKSEVAKDIVNEIIKRQA